MGQTFPEGVRDILADVGQAAFEVETVVNGFREFVTVFRCETNRMTNFDQRFPYLKGESVVYRLMRFRVDTNIIDKDDDCSMEDLIGLQSIYVPSENAAIMILDIWEVPASSLLPPNKTSIPV
jgi:hypothetical protein